MKASLTNRRLFCHLFLIGKKIGKFEKYGKSNIDTIIIRCRQGLRISTYILFSLMPTLHFPISFIQEDHSSYCNNASIQQIFSPYFQALQVYAHKEKGKIDASQNIW